MAPNLQKRGKVILPQSETATPVESSTAHEPTLIDSPTPSQSSNTLDRDDVAQLIAEQLAISRRQTAQLLADQQNATAKLIAEQVALALAAYQSGKTQSPPEQGRYDRQETVISSVEPLINRETSFRDGPMRGTDAQELSDGLDPTFAAWKLQVSARFEDDPGWYNSERRKLDYLLRRTRGEAQVHMLAGMKDRELPGFFYTHEEALASLEQALTNPQASKEAQDLFRELRMTSSETFAQFRTRFLLLAHESHLRPEEYRTELWYKISPALQTASLAVEPLLPTYNELANHLLATDSNMRWVARTAPRVPTSSSTARNRNQAGQFLPVRSAPREGTPSLALDRPYNRSSSSLQPAVRSGASATPARRLTTLTLNLDHAGDTCHNCGKVGHRAPDCTLPRAPRTDLKEFQEPLDSESDNEDLTDVSGKD
jgi:hypothetical protein